MNILQGLIERVLASRRTVLFGLILVIVFFISSLGVIFVDGAPECGYGTLDAWFREEGDIWMNTTAHTSLKRGEPFEVKAMVSAKTDLVVLSLHLWETGESDAANSSFEVIEGPSGFYSQLNVFDVRKNASYNFTWKMRVKPDASWVNGNAPLNIRAQFNRDWDDELQIQFTMVNIYIIDEPWEGYEEQHINDTGNGGNTTENNHKYGTLGFELLLVICALALILFWKQKTR